MCFPNPGSDGRYKYGNVCHVDDDYEGFNLFYLLMIYYNIWNRAKIPCKAVRWTRARSSHPQGLFGLSALQEPGDFIKLSEKAMNRVDVLRNDIKVSLGASYPEETLLALDSVSNEVCSVIDAAELCRHVHDDQEWRTQAEKSFWMLSTFIHSLNGDSALYKKLADVVNTPSSYTSLSEESKIFAKDLMKEFESEGIHLNATDRECIMDLHGKVVAQETLVMQNISSEVDVSVTFPVGPLDHSDASSVRAYLANFTPQPTDLSMLHCPVCPRIGGMLLSRASSPALRGHVWHGVRRAPTANVAAVGGLVRTRHELARALEYESYAHKVLENRVLRSPLAVDAFITKTAEAIRPAAEVQMAELSSLKRRLNGGDNNALMPWDLTYFSHIYKQSLGGSDVLTSVRKHFPISACLEGIEALFLKLFNIKMIRQRMTEGESWTSHIESPGIYSYRVETADGGMPLGQVYLDLFPRPNKIPAAAHFTVRCGCSNTSQVDGTTTPVRDGEHQHQLPIVALVFNMNGHGQASEVCLSVQELETFFHEWGHALHSILSRTTFQHLSGTRGPLDAVEVPSHLMEEFARDSRVLSALAPSAPAGLIEEALAQQGALSAVELQTQLLFGAADQTAFGPRAAELVKGASDDHEIFARLEAAVGEDQQRLTCLPMGPGPTPVPIMQLTSHGHLTNYGGAYYSYLFARMYAAQIYDRHFATDPSNAQGGQLVWKGMLQYGASRDAGEMLTNVGGDFSPELYTRKFTR